MFSSRIPENCAHTRASLTTPLSADEFSLPTHDRLNSGLVVLRPSQATFDGIVDFLNTDERVPGYKFPDQDLLADFFKDRFLPISYRYNALKTLRYCHAPMWRDELVKNVHYILKKPWNCQLPEGDPDYDTHKWCVAQCRARSESLANSLTRMISLHQVVGCLPPIGGTVGPRRRLGRRGGNGQSRSAPAPALTRCCRDCSASDSPKLSRYPLPGAAEVDMYIRI